MCNCANKSEKCERVTSVADEVLASYPDATRDMLIPILQKIQSKEGYLSQKSIMAVASHLKIASSKVFGVATFYNQFRFAPVGKYHIMVCRGTACHVKGSGALLESLKRELKIDVGGTTKDGIFSLETVSCIGACGLAPVISVNGNFHAKLSTDDIPKIVAQYKNLEGK